MSKSMGFEGFLADLAVELQSLPAEDGSLSVVRLSETIDTPCQISIGVGHQAMPYPPGSVPGAPTSTRTFPVALNNKADWNGLVEGRVSSIAMLVSKVSDEDELFHLWRDNIGAADHRAPLAQLSLCVEDASPDSCFGLLMLLARLRGVPLKEIPKRWISYIDGWERGFASYDPLAIEYGVLHNALVHGLVDHDPRGAWIDGLALLTTCLSRNVDPSVISTATGDAITATAAAALRFERAAYEQSRDVMTRLQVELPMAAHPDRYLLVDAIVAEERLLMGIHKTCWRNDRAHSFLGRGYTVNVMYRPKAQGDGNDITLSLDPASGLSLQSLWEALEREEDSRWGGERRDDDPRRDLSRYPDGLRPDGTRAPEQPWYHNPDFTLIAAPKNFADKSEAATGNEASKLSWSDVLGLFWKEYNPFRRIKILPGAGKANPKQPVSEDRMTSLQACPDGISDSRRSCSRRKLRIGRWYRPDNMVPPLQWSPTLGRMLAACLVRPPSDDPIEFDALQTAPAHRHVTLSSGLAVISEDGVYLLIHDLYTEIKGDEMQASFEACAEVMDWIDAHTDEVAGLVDTVRDHLSGKRTAKLSRDLKIYNKICTLQLHLLELRHRLEAGSLDLSSQQFRDSIMQGWGIIGRLDTLYRDLEEAKTILTAHGDLVTNRRIAFLTYFGFPLVLGGSLAGLLFSAEPIWPPSWANFDGLSLLSFFVIVLLGSIVLFEISRNSDRKSRLDSSGSPDQSAREGLNNSPRLGDNSATQQD